MSFCVTLLPSEISFSVNTNETVLDAALRQNISLSYLCRLGVCTSCKGKLLQGKIKYEHEILGLSAEEQHQGEILLCSAFPLSDLIINAEVFLNTKSSTINAFAYNVIESVVYTNSITGFKLQAESNIITYQAGQYVKIIHGNYISPMSIACAPFNPAIIELHLAHPRENLQALDLLQTLTSKNKILIQGPYGTCTDAVIDLKRPLVFIANNTGFAPTKAVIEQLIKNKMLPKTHLYWHGTQLDEIYDQALVQQWMHHFPDFLFTPLIENEISKYILEDYPDLAAYQVYAVDMQSTIYSMLEKFTKQGLQKKYFYSDALSYIE